MSCGQSSQHYTSRKTNESSSCSSRFFPEGYWFKWQNKHSGITI